MKVGIAWSKETNNEDIVNDILSTLNTKMLKKALNEVLKNGIADIKISVENMKVDGNERTFILTLDTDNSHKEFKIVRKDSYLSVEGDLI